MQSSEYPQRYFPVIHHGAVRILRGSVTLTIWCDGKRIGLLKAFREDVESELSAFQFICGGDEATRYGVLNNMHEYHRKGYIKLCPKRGWILTEEGRRYTEAKKRGDKESEWNR